MSQITSRFTFPGANGDELAARLDLPRGKPLAFALFAHCFTCTKDIYAANRIADCLNKRGIGVLRFDFTGLGASEGEFANTNFTSNADDLIAAANHMRAQNMAPQIMIGHSLGGAAVLASAAGVPECKAVATIGAPADPGHVAHIFKDSLAEIEAKGEADVLLAGRPFTIQKQFLDDIAQTQLSTKIQKLGRALLVLHGPLDQTVGIENASEIFGAAKHPKSFISLDKADHLLSKKDDAHYAAEAIAVWASRYISNDDASLAQPRAVEGSVVVAETGTGKFTNFVVTGSGHVLQADEPISVGGDDTGPTPYDLLLAAVGTCKVMTMRMYAARKGYNLARAEVRLTHDKIHAKDCEECETPGGKVDKIEAQISISGELSADERQKIFEIAERCPVHRTITNEIIIRAELLD